MTAAPCRHFGECGGCATQDVPYADEVARKAAALSDLFGRAVEVAPSPREYGYRTRMDYVFAWHKLGLRKKGDPRGILDLEECLLPERFDLVLKVKEALHRLGLKSYNYTRHKGYLRYVSLRVAPVLGQTMLVFLTNGSDPAIHPLLDEAAAWADAVVWGVSNRRADVSYGEVAEYRNRLWIEERIGDLTFRFGPNSFFQANPWQAERLYAHVAERVHGVAADVCCGVGGLALFAARRAERVVGIDNNAEGVTYAEHNAASNGIDNVEFRVGEQQDFLREHACDTLILDPPRGGLGFRSARRVGEVAPARVVYVSCNPKVLAAELPHFRGYAVTELTGFDLFPRTPHCELVAVLERT